MTMMEAPPNEGTYTPPTQAPGFMMGSPTPVPNAMGMVADSSSSDTGFNQALFLALSRRLKAIGMSSLFAYNAETGEMSGKLWDWVRSGTVTDDPDVLAALVEATPEYQARFPAIAAQQAQVAAGHAVHVMTAEEVLAYEDTVTGLMKRAGMPTQFYDTPQAIQSMAAMNISALEVDDRVNKGWVEIHNAPQIIKDAMYNYFGVQGDAALAAWYLDSEHTVDNLERMTRAASLGGRGFDYNVNLDRVQAEDLARAGVSDAQATAGFSDIARQKPLFDENVHELEDLAAETTGVAASFGTQGAGDAQRKLEQRRGERAASFAGQGGAASSQQGVFGLSEANQ